MLTDLFVKLGRPILLVLSVAVTAFISRFFGEDTIVEYTLLLTYASLLSIFITAGIGQTVLAEYTDKEIEEAKSNSIVLCTVTSIVSLCVFSMFIIIGLCKLDHISILILAIIQSFLVIYKTSNVLAKKIEYYYYPDLFVYILILISLGVLKYFSIAMSIAYIVLLINLSVFLFYYKFYIINHKSKLEIEKIKSLATKGLYASASVLVGYACMKFNMVASTSYFRFDVSDVSLIVYSMIVVDGIVLFISSLLFSDINKIKDGSIKIYKTLMKYGFLSCAIILSFNFIVFDIFVYMYDIKRETDFKALLWVFSFCVPFIVMMKVVCYFILMARMYKSYLASYVLYFILLICTNYFISTSILDLAWSYLFSSALIIFVSLGLYAFNKK